MAGGYRTATSPHLQLVLPAAKLGQLQLTPSLRRRQHACVGLHVTAAGRRTGMTREGGSMTNRAWQSAWHVLGEWSGAIAMARGLP